MIRRYFAKLRAQLQAILAANLSPGSIGRAVGIGAFIGALPIYGIHLGVCVVVARFLKLNEAVMYGAANISNPFFAPFLIAVEVEIGEYMRYGKVSPADTLAFGHSFWGMLQTAPDLFLSCVYGSVPAGIVLGALLGPLAFLIANRRVSRGDGRPPDPP